MQALLAEYGGLLDLGRYDDWLALFAAECRYAVVPRENHEAGLPVALILCDSRAMLEDRIAALRQANKYNIHTDRHIIGLPRIIAAGADRIEIEAPFAVYQTDPGRRDPAVRDRPLSRPARTRAGTRCASPKSWCCSTPSPSRRCSRRRFERGRPPVARDGPVSPSSTLVVQLGAERTPGADFRSE